jgi:phenylalanyl-tRNA synthetase beta chain
MKLPLSWLKDWVDPQWSTSELAQRLTMTGFEVEGIAPAAAPFTGVVVAQITATAPHPQAEKLQVCQVDAGSGAPLQIVCGARNARAGLKVALAQVGAVLPNEVKIGAAKLRGVESHGMLCSAKELGLAATSQGLLELPAGAPAGADLRDYLGLEDVVLDVSIYPNRGDAMSVRGVAREISALSRAPLGGPQFTPVPAHADDAAFPVVVEAPDAAPRMITRVIRGIDNRRPTPVWMQERLRRCGLRPISPVVDVTNYLLIELGQPMHAYELGRLAGEMRVRMARAGEPLTLLDGREIVLAPDILVIADARKPIGLAGIMGGEGTSITEDARDIFLEVAYFAPAAIAGRARRFGLQTDASQRFERGVDPALQEAAAERATQLILEIAGGAAGPLQVFEDRSALAASATRTPIALRRRRLETVIGMPLATRDVEAALRALGLQPSATADGWLVTPPSWRFDLAIEEDLIEEALRHLGYDTVPEIPAQRPMTFARLPEAVAADRVLLDALVARGYCEAINYSFVDPQLQQRLFPGVAALMLSNPIASDLSAMRVSLWPGLVHAALENQRRQQERLKLFELATVFTLDPAGTLREPRRLAGIAFGTRLPEQWGGGREAADFFDIKADLDALLALSGAAPEFSFVPPVGAQQLACLHPGRCARILRADEPIGWLGELHPELVRELHFTYAPILFEVDVERATAGTLTNVILPSRFPQVRRDISFTLPLGTPLSAVRERVSVGSISLLRDLRVFDLYQGPGIESGRKSVALGLIFQDNNRTLTDEEADRIVASVAADLQTTLDAKIRE